MIKLSQKRTCEGCKALYMEQGGTHRCELNYKYNEHFKPSEPCPKPKTIMEFYECMEWYMR